MKRKVFTASVTTSIKRFLVVCQTESIQVCVNTMSTYRSEHRSNHVFYFGEHMKYKNTDLETTRLRTENIREREYSALKYEVTSQFLKSNQNT